MNTVYLMSECKESFFIECEMAGIVCDGEIVTSDTHYEIYIIGPINGCGYFANLKARAKVGIEHLSINVDNPVHIFSGDKK